MNNNKNPPVFLSPINNSPLPSIRKNNSNANANANTKITEQNMKNAITKEFKKNINQNQAKIILNKYKAWRNTQPNNANSTVNKFVSLGKNGKLIVKRFRFKNLLHTNNYVNVYTKGSMASMVSSQYKRAFMRQVAEVKESFASVVKKLHNLLPDSTVFEMLTIKSETLIKFTREKLKQIKIILAFIKKNYITKRQASRIALKIVQVVGLAAIYAIKSSVFLSILAIIYGISIGSSGAVSPGPVVESAALFLFGPKFGGGSRIPTNQVNNIAERYSVNLNNSQKNKLRSWINSHGTFVNVKTLKNRINNKVPNLGLFKTTKSGRLLEFIETL
jgi:hypothetical protein